MKKTILFTIILLACASISNSSNYQTINKHQAESIAESETKKLLDGIVQGRPNKQWLYNYNVSLKNCIKETLLYNQKLYENAWGMFERQKIVNDVNKICLDEMLKEIKSKQ